MDALNRVPLSVQKAYVATMLTVIARSLVTASQTDPVVKKEVQGFRVGQVIEMTVLPNVANFLVQVNAKHEFERIHAAKRIDLSIKFKHVSLAYLVFTFQEGTAQAYANDRLIADGDISDSIRFVRCLNRLEALILPKPIASLAVKAYPKLPLSEKIQTAGRIYLGAAKSFLGR